MTTMTHEELESRMLDLLEDICLLDSMAAVELLVSIEDEFGVSIAPTEVPRNEMNTVNLIIEQVEKRMA